MKRVALVMGTRPEVIKLAPVGRALRRLGVEVLVIQTGQHDRTLPSLLHRYGLREHRRLAVMRPGQSLAVLGARLLAALSECLDTLQPDAVMVVGDTLSAQMGGLAAFYAGIQVAHVEAGLRTHDPWAPFPEESSRRILATVSHWHFAPSLGAAANLRRERVDGIVVVTGNPVVDALRDAMAFLGPPPPPTGTRQVVATIHRRENHPHLPEIFGALADLAQYPGIAVLLPVHPNPVVTEAARRWLGSTPVRLLPPLDYLPWISLLRRAQLIITDSGGLQEEAPVLGLPLLVAREDTERPEVIDQGYGYLVGHDRDLIVATALKALAGTLFFRRGSPYGDGHAGERIAHYLIRALDAWSPPFSRT